MNGPTRPPRGMGDSEDTGPLACLDYPGHRAKQDKKGPMGPPGSAAKNGPQGQHWSKRNPGPHRKDGKSAPPTDKGGGAGVKSRISLKFPKEAETNSINS